MSTDTAAYWIVYTLFFVACVWAKPKTELRFLAVMLAGMAMHMTGWIGGQHELQRLQDLRRAETTILTDRNMPHESRPADHSEADQAYSGSFVLGYRCSFMRAPDGGDSGARRIIRDCVPDHQ